MPRFLFAWVESTETAFGPEHHVEDEDVFSLRVSQREGGFASLDVTIVNPRVGLLVTGRRQWAWLSCELAPGDVVPLFFGRLVGVPQDLHEELVALRFVARPENFEEQKQALADSLRVLPWWDPLWLSDDERADPDSVLEGRPAVWHIDRVTHEVTVSPILPGEAGAPIVIEPTAAYYDSLSVTHAQSPARRAVVQAEVRWDEAGRGGIDLTQSLLQRFHAEQPPNVFDPLGNPIPTTGVVATMAGEGLVNAWPPPGRRIGGGWTVGQSEALLLSPPATNIELTEAEARELFHSGGATAGTAGNPPLASAFGGVAYVPVQKIVDSSPMVAHSWGGLMVAGNFDVLLVVVDRIGFQLEVQWEAARARTERIEFVLDADVQPVLSAPDDAEILRLPRFGPVSVDAPVDPPELFDHGEPETEPPTEHPDGLQPAIGDSRRQRFFATARGKLALENLIARARAALLYRARAVEVHIEMPFADGLDLACDRAATILDDRLPQGQATGKVIAYALAADGDSGELTARVTLGCVIGRGGEVTPAPGDPVWAEDGYVADGYQRREHQVTVPLAGDVGYGDFDGYQPDGDGVDLLRVSEERHVAHLAVTGSFDRQETEIEARNLNGYWGPMIIQRIQSVKTGVQLAMHPVSGGPFDTEVPITLTELKVPRTIDLEEARRAARPDRDKINSGAEGRKA